SSGKARQAAAWPSVTRRVAGPVSFLSFRDWREDLIRIGIRGGPLHDVEAEVGSLMAVVARLGECVERGFERLCAFALDHCPEVCDRRGHHPRDGVLRRNRRSFVRGVVLDDVVETLAELLDFVCGEVPVAG